jgi:hypothetical protein
MIEQWLTLCHLLRVKGTGIIAVVFMEQLKLELARSMVLSALEGDMTKKSFRQRCLRCKMFHSATNVDSPLCIGIRVGMMKSGVWATPNLSGVRNTRTSRLERN